MVRDSVSLAEARRIALAAQGFDRLRPARVNERDLRRTILRLGLLQIDYVNLVGPAQYTVLFSRLGPYKKSILDDLVYRRREFTEQWAHEASIVPVATWPLLRYRMAAHRIRPYDFAKFIDQNPEYVKGVLEEVRARGPLGASELGHPEGTDRRMPKGYWVGTVPRAVLEAHFGRGDLAVAERRSDFSRVFDLAERVVAAEHHGRSIETEEAQRELLRIAARAHGLGTAADLADYFRMLIRDARPRILELVAAGELREVRVEGWRETAYLYAKAELPARIDAAALLAPFDPLIWFRPRVARLFGFDYRFEIFVPAEKRKWGCYVLPFLLGERLAARVDLKADRVGGRLMVPAAFLETGQEVGEVAGALGLELQTMAGWLGLESVIVKAKGGFGRRLATALRL